MKNKDIKEISEMINKLINRHIDLTQFTLAKDNLFMNNKYIEMLNKDINDLRDEIYKLNCKLNKKLWECIK